MKEDRPTCFCFFPFCAGTLFGGSESIDSLEEWNPEHLTITIEKGLLNRSIDESVCTYVSVELIPKQWRFPSSWDEGSEMLFQTSLCNTSTANLEWQESFDFEELDGFDSELCFQLYEAGNDGSSHHLLGEAYLPLASFFKGSYHTVRKKVIFEDPAEANTSVEAGYLNVAFFFSCSRKDAPFI